MRKVLLALAGVLVLYRVCFQVFDLPGNPGTRSRRRSGIWGVEDLRAELGESVPESVYQVFTNAVAMQLAEQDERAAREYGKLTCIPLADGSGTFDLRTASRVLTTNMNLLAKGK